MPYLARPRLVVARVDVAPGKTLQGPQQLVQGRPLPRRDVERLAANPLGVHRQHVPLDDVPDVGDVAGLLSVP